MYLLDTFSVISSQLTSFGGFHLPIFHLLCEHSLQFSFSMKIFVFLAVVVVVFFASSCDAQPNPPVIVKQFITNYTIVADNFVNYTDSLFSGWLALDYKNGGGRFEIGGEEWVPVYFQTNLLAHPDDSSQTITGYVFEEDLCWNVGQVGKDFLVLFPLQIPMTAQFLGNTTYNGDKVGRWSWNEDYYFQSLIEMWVTWDGVIDRIFIEQIPYAGTIEWRFLNTEVGPFNPNIYNVPKLKCTPAPMSGKKLNLMQRIINIIRAITF